MKRIFLIVFIILFAFIGKSQVYQVMPQYGYDVKRMKFDSTLQIPTFCGVPTLRSNILNKAAIAYDSCNKRFYFYDPALAVWDTIMGGGSSLDTTSLSNRINAKADSNIALQKVLNNGNIAYNEEIDLYDTTNGKYRELYLTPNSGNIPLIGMVDTSDRYLVLQTSSAYNTPSIYFQNKAKTQYLLQQDSIGGYVFLPTQSGGLDTLATSKDVRAKADTGIDLQYVTDNGNTTTNKIIAESLWSQDSIYGINSVGDLLINNIEWFGNNSNLYQTSTTMRNWELPDNSGTIMLTSDTTNKWVNNITRTSGKDSIIYYIGSTRYAIKDSVGSTSGFVPYTGATLDVDLGTHKLSAQSLQVEGTNGNGHIHLKHQNSNATATGQSTALFANSNGDLKWKNAGNYYTTLNTQQTADRVYTFQNKSYTIGDSADIAARVKYTDTASMLSSFVHYQDTASLSTRINAKQNTLTNPVTGTGTTGAISKFTGTSTIGDATVDVDYLQQDMSMVAYQAMGSSIKGYNLTIPYLSLINTSYTGITSGLFLLYPIYIPKTTTITGVKWFQTVQGSYTANNYNGVALYSVSGGTLTSVASSTNDGTIWKATANTWVSKAFSSTYSAAAGIYYVGMVYSSSAQTTAPCFGATTVGQNAITKSFDFTNSLKLSLFQSAVTTLPSTITASATSASSNNVALYLY